VNKLLPTALGLMLLMSACVELPGADREPASRYMLRSAETESGSCEAPRASLDLSVLKVSAGLDTDRIARRDASTGELTYLKGARWVDTVSVMLEQRLAADLECLGFTVTSSHHRRLSHDQLVCEVRALNLVSSKDGNSADVGLSCIYSKAGSKEELNLRSTHQSRLRSWSVNNAVAATSDSYQQVFTDLTKKL
jgi:ABC-type uncharacterized transport system auxiliary subunit